MIHQRRSGPAYGLRSRTARAVSVGSVLLGFAVPVAGQEVRELTADEAVRIGLEVSPRIAASDAGVAMAEAAYREARAQGLPAVRSQASFTRLGGSIPEGEVTFPGLDTTFTLLPIELNRFSSEFSVEQPVFTGGRVRNQNRAAERDVSSAELQAEQERVEVAYEIRRAFWELFSATSRLEAANAAIAFLDEHVADVENRLAEGSALLSDVLAARTRRAESLLDRLTAENEVRAGQLVLSQRIGLSPEIRIVPVADAGVGPPSADAPPEPIDGMPPRIAAMEEEISALRFRLESIRATWLPELSAVGRYVYARPNPYAFTEQSEFRGTWEAGLLLRWNPWEGGRRSAELERMRQSVRSAEARLAEARSLAVANREIQALELRRAEEAVGVAAQIVEHAEEALRVTRDLYREGMVLSSDVLEAEQAYHAARSRFARSVAQYEIARADVLRSLGER